MVPARSVSSQRRLRLVFSMQIALLSAKEGKLAQTDSKFCRSMLNQLKTEFTELKLCAQLNLSEINHQFNRDVKWSAAEIEAESIMVMKVPSLSPPVTSRSSGSDSRAPGSERAVKETEKNGRAPGRNQEPME